MRKVFMFLIALGFLGLVSVAQGSHSTLHRETGTTIVMSVSDAGSLNQASPGFSNEVGLIQNMTQGVFVLRVTDTPGDGTMQAWVQHSADNGTTWSDLIGFGVEDTTIGVAQYAYWCSNCGLEADVVEVGPIQELALGASAVESGPIGNRLRVGDVIDSPSDAWDFTVTAVLR